jgi:hypothetical protein
MGGCVWVVNKYYSILYKGPEYPRILMSVGDLDPIPCKYRRTSVCTCVWRKDLF